MATTQEQEKIIFGVIFDMANKLQVVGDRFLKRDGMTTKQWWLTLVVEQCGATPPTLGEVAKRLGTSHQNAKQIALKLESKGFLRIEKDLKDQRTLRLTVTDKSRKFWDARLDQDNDFISQIFVNMKPEEISVLFNVIMKLHQNITQLNENDFE